MMLESFVLYIARDEAKRHGKNILLSEETFFGIVPRAYQEIDKLYNHQIKSNEDYVRMALESPEITEKMLHKVKYLWENLGVKKNDNNYPLKVKKQIMENSIEVFDIFFKDLKENYNYKKFQDENDEKYDGNYIVENLRIKMQDESELNRILKSLENIDMNFTIDYENKKIYPIVVDILTDIVSMEYEWQISKELIQSIHQKWDEALEAQRERNFFSFTAFEKMKLIKTVKYDSLRVFFLAEYSRTLNVEKKKLRTFIQHIFYYIIGNHKYTPKLEFNLIDDIPARPFILEKTKMVIGGV